MQKAFTAIIQTFVGLAVVIVGVGPFIVHVAVTVKTNWAAMLILGLVVPPIGWIHGVGLIFKWW